MSGTLTAWRAIDRRPIDLLFAVLDSPYMQLADTVRIPVSALSFKNRQQPKLNEARNSSIENSHDVKKRSTWASTLLLRSTRLTQCTVIGFVRCAHLLQLRGPNSNSPVAPLFASTLPRPSIPYARSDSHVATYQHRIRLRFHTPVLSLGDARRVWDLV